MKLSEVKSALKELETIGFELPNGELVASHFHVTEVGKITKHFIDCGGVERKEEVVNFQLFHCYNVFTVSFFNVQTFNVQTFIFQIFKRSNFQTFKISNFHLSNFQTFKLPSFHTFKLNMFKFSIFKPSTFTM